MNNNTLLDQMIDNNKKASKRYGKDNIIPPSASKNKSNNGIPTLISSDGINRPVVDPNILSTQGMDAAVSSMGESLSTATPYMLRNDGKLLTCGDAHPYIKRVLVDSDKKSIEELINERSSELEWFYDNTNSDEVRTDICGFIGALHENANEYELNSDILESLFDKYSLSVESGSSVFDTNAVFNELNDLTNQEFCRLRTSSHYYGGSSNRLYCRISSLGFDWYGLIWQVVIDHKNWISNITIESDPQSVNKKGIYFYKGRPINEMPIDEFLEFSGTPVIESTKGTNFHEMYGHIHPIHIHRTIIANYDKYYKEHFISINDVDNRSMSESVEIDEMTKDEVLDVMKSNFEYIRTHANSLFNNLNLDCEWDSSSELIHILVRFNDNVQVDDMNADKIYPYPLDIILPYDLDPVITYNSKSSLTEPDIETEGSVSSDDTDLGISNWVNEDADETELAHILFSELGGLDDVLNNYVIDESLTESLSDNSDLTLIDSVMDIEWYMDANQNSVILKNEDELIAEFKSVDEAQEWWNQFLSDNGEY